MSVPHSHAEAIVPVINLGQLRERLTQDGEIALVDVREQGVQARDGYILRSAGLPLSTLELRAATLLPRLNAPIVVTDAGDEVLARRAAVRLQALGYNRVSVLHGGVAAWQADGGELFTGTSALSKGFGEFVEQRYGTPHLSVEALKRKLDAGENLVLLDGRTLAEFEHFSIPGAQACPNGELVYRVHPLLSDDSTPVVVNCAGRTRSIIGAQTLINAGLKNPVLALENGTMDWLTAGYSLQSGVQATVAAPAAGHRGAAIRAASELIDRFGLQVIDHATLQQYRLEAGQRTLYVYDVRTQAEYAAGHLPGARWAEGGQLVQGVDVYVGVQNARIVLVDDADGVRAVVTASWLAQLGWGEASILRVEAGQLSEQGADVGPLLAPLPRVDTVTPRALVDLLASAQTTVLDLENSLTYAAGHVPGAWFAVRARFDQRLQDLPGNGPIVLTSSDGRLAQLAVSDVRSLTSRQVLLLEGGTGAWAAAGRALETGESRLWDSTDDVWRSPYQVADQHSAFREYLDWELGLVEQLERDGTARFRTFLPA